jgi:hypothetical protein
MQSIENTRLHVLAIQRSAGGSQGGAAKVVQMEAAIPTKVDLTGIVWEEKRIEGGDGGCGELLKSGRNGFGKGFQGRPHQA